VILEITVLYLDQVKPLCDDDDDDDDDDFTHSSNYYYSLTLK